MKIYTVYLKSGHDFNINEEQFQNIKQTTSSVNPNATNCFMWWDDFMVNYNEIAAIVEDKLL